MAKDFSQFCVADWFGNELRHAGLSSLLLEDLFREGGQTHDVRQRYISAIFFHLPFDDVADLNGRRRTIHFGHAVVE